MSTTATDVLVIVFAALEPDEQREALQRMSEVQARRDAGEQSDTERVLNLVARGRRVRRSPAVCR